MTFPQQPHQPQEWASQPAPDGGRQVPIRRKTPWMVILLAALVIAGATVALLVWRGNSAMPQFSRTQARDVCGLLIGDRSIDEVAAIAGPRNGWTETEARNVAKEMRSRGCGVKN